MQMEHGSSCIDPRSASWSVCAHIRLPNSTLCAPREFPAYLNSILNPVSAKFRGPQFLSFFSRLVKLSIRRLACSEFPAHRANTGSRALPSSLERKSRRGDVEDKGSQNDVTSLSTGYARGSRKALEETGLPRGSRERIKNSNFIKGLGNREKKW